MNLKHLLISSKTTNSLYSKDVFELSTVNEPISRYINLFNYYLAYMSSLMFKLIHIQTPSLTLMNVNSPNTMIVHVIAIFSPSV